jgi:thiol-disulfide isomerase/thioredoxin
MVPSKSDMSAVVAASARLAVSEARACLALPAPNENGSLLNVAPLTSQAIDLAEFALDAQLPAKVKSPLHVVPGSADDAGLSTTPNVPKRQVLIFKATWCGACQLLTPAWPKLRRVNWRVGSGRTDHFRLVDSDEHPELISRYGITALPTIVLVENGREIDRTGQILNAIDLAEFYYGRLR